MSQGPGGAERNLSTPPGPPSGAEVAFDPTWPVPDGGWPGWVWSTPYDGARHPGAEGAALETSVAIPHRSSLAPGASLERGANCQRYAYAVVALFGLTVPPLRSSELWEHGPRVTAVDLRPLDLVLTNRSAEAYGAHVGVVLGADAVLHLCAEVGVPAVWTWADFASRERYAVVLGGVRPS